MMRFLSLLLLCLCTCGVCSPVVVLEVVSAVVAVTVMHVLTCLRVFVGPGFVSTSPAFMRSSTSHPAGPHDWLAPKKRVNVDQQGFSSQTFHVQLSDTLISSTIRKHSDPSII